MFQRKIDEIFKELPIVFGIADDCLVVGMIEMEETVTTHYEEYYKYVGRMT